MSVRKTPVYYKNYNLELVNNSKIKKICKPFKFDFVQINKEFRNMIRNLIIGLMHNIILIRCNSVNI